MSVLSLHLLGIPFPIHSSLNWCHLLGDVLGKCLVPKAVPAPPAGWESGSSVAVLGWEIAEGNNLHQLPAVNAEEWGLGRMSDCLSLFQHTCVGHAFLEICKTLVSISEVIDCCLPPWLQQDIRQWNRALLAFPHGLAFWHLELLRTPVLRDQVWAKKPLWAWRWRDLLHILQAGRRKSSDEYQ